MAGAAGGGGGEKALARAEPPSIGGRTLDEKRFSLETERPLWLRGRWKWIALFKETLITDQTVFRPLLSRSLAAILTSNIRRLVKIFGVRES